MAKKNLNPRISAAASTHVIDEDKDKLPCDHSAEQTLGSSGIGIVYLCPSCNLLQFPRDEQIHGRWVTCQ
ncbi:MAG: hypothetical protein FI725_02115 [SAR202 cluster bacterium]|nr:hypothetical protein [SAR202 cluster bacterium]